MVVEFTTNLVDSSYVGCPLFKKNVFMKQAKKLRMFFIIFTKKYNYILIEKSFFLSENG